jgi:hypothetical protein
VYQTVQVSSRVSAQGEIVEKLPDGRVVVRDGLNVYSGLPVAPVVARAALAQFVPVPDPR